MARSTFEGPILSGDSRFGPLRDVGYARLSQECFIDLSTPLLALPATLVALANSSMATQSPTSTQPFSLPAAALFTLQLL